jgi:hemerythrin superfamily protein
MAQGSLQARAGCDPFKSLIAEHGQLLSTLDEMEQSRPEEKAKRARLFLKLKRTLAKHATAEEDVVYPLLTGPGEREDAARALYDDHVEMKIAMYRLEQALKGDDNWTERVRELQGLIGPHAKQEEEIEFPRLRERLSDKNRIAAGRDVLREEAMVL